jgi:hypothetical protein
VRLETNEQTISGTQAKKMEIRKQNIVKTVKELAKPNTVP